MTNEIAKERIEIPKDKITGAAVQQYKELLAMLNLETYEHRRIYGDIENREMVKKKQERAEERKRNGYFNKQIRFLKWKLLYSEVDKMLNPENVTRKLLRTKIGGKLWKKL